MSDIAGTTRDAIDTEIVWDDREYTWAIPAILASCSVTPSVASIIMTTTSARSTAVTAEILFISAKTGQRTQKLFDMIDVVLENNSMRVATGVLNEIMTEAVALQQPPSDKGKRLKLYYMTQVAVKPPTFVNSFWVRCPVLAEINKISAYGIKLKISRMRRVCL